MSLRKRRRASVSIHTSADVSIETAEAEESIDQHTSAYVSIRQRMKARTKKQKGEAQRNRREKHKTKQKTDPQHKQQLRVTSSLRPHTLVA
jgi:hypothetical protein